MAHGNEAERLAALRLHRILDTEAEPAFDDIVALAARVCGTPIALISLVDETRLWFKARVGLGQAELPRQFSFCDHAIGQPDPTIVPDAVADARFAPHPLVSGPDGIRFYAGALLVTEDGQALGTLCVLDRQVRALSLEQAEILTALGRHVVRLLERRRSMNDLADAVAARAGAQQALEESERRYRELVDNAQDVVYTHDLQGRFLSVNGAALRLTGYSSAEAVRMTLADVVVPEQLDRAREMTARKVAGEDVSMYELDIVRKDGERRTLEVNTRLLTRDGRPHAVLGIARDVTEKKRAEREMEAQKNLFAMLLAVARATAEQPELQDTLRRTLDVVKSLTGAEGASIFLVDAAGALRQSVLAHVSQAPVRNELDTARIMSDGLAGWVSRNRRPALIRDTLEDDRWLRGGDGPGVSARSALSVPISSGDTLEGVLTVIHSQPDHFDADQLQFIEAAAGQIALALRNAQLFDATERMANRQGLLYEALRSLGNVLDPEAVAQAAVEAIAQRTGWLNVVVAVPTADGEHWHITASSEALSHVGRQPLRAGVVGRAFTTGRTQRVADVTLDPDYVEGSSLIRSELCVPLRRSGRLLGVLNVESDMPGAFNDDDAQLAESLAEAVALGVDNARLYRDLADQGERLRALIEASRDGILLVGSEGRLHVVNAPALRLLSVGGSAEEWSGRPASDLLARLRETAPEAAEVAEAELARGGEAAPAEGEYEAPPLTVGWLSLPVFADGTWLGRLFVLRDVTEDRLLARTREELTRTMVHDLRNPLTALRGGLEYLERDSTARLSEAQRSTVRAGLRASDKLLGLVDAILDVSRLEAGALPLELRPLNLRELVDDVLDALRPLVDEKSLRIVMDLPADLPRIEADTDLLGRVVQNLVGNAIKFSGQDGEISISAEAHDGGVRVTVQDTGPGIPPTLRGRLFQKFATGDDRRRGSGLGLAFCRLAIEAHGGRIWADAPSAGARLSFTLPIEAPDAA